VSGVRFIGGPTPLIEFPETRASTAVSWRMPLRTNVAVTKRPLAPRLVNQIVVDVQADGLNIDSVQPSGWASPALQHSSCWPNTEESP